MTSFLSLIANNYFRSNLEIVFESVSLNWNDGSLSPINLFIYFSRSLFVSFRHVIVRWLLTNHAAALKEIWTTIDSSLLLYPSTTIICLSLFKYRTFLSLLFSSLHTHLKNKNNEKNNSPPVEFSLCSWKTQKTCRKTQTIDKNFQHWRKKQETHCLQMNNTFWKQTMLFYFWIMQKRKEQKRRRKNTKRTSRKNQEDIRRRSKKTEFCRIVWKNVEQCRIQQKSYF